VVHPKINMDKNIINKVIILFIIFLLTFFTIISHL